MVKVKAAICLHKQCITKYTLVKLDIYKINGFPQPLPVCLVHCWEAVLVCLIHGVRSWLSLLVLYSGFFPSFSLQAKTIENSMFSYFISTKGKRVLLYGRKSCLILFHFIQIVLPLVLYKYQDQSLVKQMYMIFFIIAVE